jgi:hypothetical protein
VEARPAVVAQHRRPVPGLTVIYDAHADPGIPGTYDAHGKLAHQLDKQRVRVYLSAYLDEQELAGHLAFWLHPGGTAYIKKVDVHPSISAGGSRARCTRRSAPSIQAYGSTMALSAGKERRGGSVIAPREGSTRSIPSAR